MGIDKLKKGLQVLNHSFGGKQPIQRIEIYAKSFIEKGIDPDVCYKRCKEASSWFTEFPSQKELLGFIRNYHDDEVVKEKTKEEKQLESESKSYEKIKKMFLSKYDQAKLNSIVTKWVNGVYGGTENLINAGFEISLFEKPALFDLAQATGDLDRAIEIGINKKLKIQGER
jgi:hypothetical protein